jgi:hypothetical protein
MDLGSSTELITLKPWSTGKQLPLGFSVFGQKRKKKQRAASTKPQATSSKRLTGPAG